MTQKEINIVCNALNELFDSQKFVQIKKCADGRIHMTCSCEPYMLPDGRSYEYSTTSSYKKGLTTAGKIFAVYSKMYGKELCK